MQRHINKSGIDIIKKYEGLYLKSYLCPSKKWTIGYGHTLTAQKGMVITEKQAEDLLREDLNDCEWYVSNLVKVPLNENQFSALVCFVFNIGVGSFEKSTLLRLLNRGWYEQVPAQLIRWNKSNGKVLSGLEKRREEEGRLWKMNV